MTDQQLSPARDLTGQAVHSLAGIEASHLLARLSAVILFSILALGLVVPKVAGAGYLLLALIAAVWLSLTGNWWRPRLKADEKLLVLAVSLFIGVYLLAWAGHGFDPAGKDGVGRILRIGLVIPIYLFIRRVDGLEPAWWNGLSMGAILAGGYAIWFFLSGQPGEFQYRVGGPTNPIYFGGIALAFGLMLLPRITDPELGVPMRSLAVFAVLMALTASTLSGSRGAWVALPPLLLLYIFTLGARQPPRWRYGVPAAMLLITLFIALTPVVPLSERFSDGASALVSISRGESPAGTLGLRMEMWEVAGALVAERPLTGAGPGGFRQALEASVEDGRLDAEFLEFRHPHSEYLSALTLAGIPGLIALLLLFGLPTRRFITLWQTGLTRTRLMGWCGLTAMVVLATMALSESIFERNSGVLWFSIFTACASGLVHARRRQDLFGSMPARRQTLSVIVITRDEADRIARCLSSVAGWADEIIVLDCGSTDDTVEIARQFTHRVEVTDWPGFGKQKQRALDRATCDWVLSLDADEVVSEELRREIDLVLARRHPSFDGYYLPWSIRALGGEMQFGRWSRAPLRLFRRTRGRFTPAEVHEKVVLDEGCRSGRLEGPLVHYVYRDLDHARAKLARYAELQARERRSQGHHRILPLGPAVRAAINLIDNLILRAAFLDGRPGLIMTGLHARYTYGKYRRLRQLQRSA